jgi:serine/threonine protein kinase
VSNGVPLRSGLEAYPGYRLRHVLGRGGFAEVWEAETADGRTVALKFMPCNDGLSAAKEVRSIENVRKIKHRYILEIENVWTNLGYIVIAMELADGSLLDLLDAYLTEFKGPIPADQVCVHMAQAAEGLDYMNSRVHLLDGRKVGLQHCDVKPSNLLLFGDTVKIADFGLASPTSSMLRTHRRAGTLDFAAPEVFQGRLSNHTDQYALAISYCHLRGGRLPFRDTPATFVKTYVRPPADLTMLPEPERPAVLRALSATPQDRWPTCVEFVNSLTKAALKG